MESNHYSSTTPLQRGTGRRPQNTSNKRFGSGAGRALSPSAGGSTSSQQQQTEILNKCFALSLACEYLHARDLLALSLTSSAVRHRLRDGGAVRTIRIDLRRREDPARTLRMFSGSFPKAKELIAIGTREQVFFGLQGAARLRLTRLSVTLDGEEGADDRFLDGFALAVEYGAFVHLERLELRNVGPFSPRAFIKACSGSPALQMLRLTHCPTLMDSTLALIVSHASSLRELSLEECPALATPVLASQSLVRLKLAKCFSLLRVNVNRCPNLMILDLPWTAHLVEPPWMYGLGALRYLSLAGAARLERFEVERLPATLSTLDLGCCTKLKFIQIEHCPHLIHLNVSLCIELESIVLRTAKMLETLDLSLLVNLRRVEISGDRSLKRLLVDGCDKLYPRAVFCNEEAMLVSSSSRFRRVAD